MQLLLCLVVLLDYFLITSGKDCKHVTWSRDGDYCYKAMSSPDTWERARSTCISEGGYLAIPDSSSRQNWLNNVMDGNNWDRMWINAKERLGPWNWVQDGTPVVNQGCFQGTLLLCLEIARNTNITPISCLSSCEHLYRYAGVFMSNGEVVCRCGNNFYVTIGGTSGCTTNCPSDNSSYCGSTSQMIILDRNATERDILWYRQQPNNYNSYQGCMVIHGSNSFKWGDEFCYLRTESGHICQYSASSSGACNDVWLPTSGKCVSIHSGSGMNWYEAKHECQGQGGYLATVDTRIFLDELKLVSVLNSQRGKWWIGGYSRRWYWDNDLNRAMRYSNWGPQQPSTNGQDCASINKFSGDVLYRWDDLSCSESRNYVCQMHIGTTTTSATTTLQMLTQTPTTHLSITADGIQTPITETSCDEEVDNIVNATLVTDVSPSWPPTTHPHVTQSIESPYVIKTWPKYGPKSGGTIITVEGHHLKPESVVRLGDDVICETIYGNSTVLLAVTPKHSSEKTELVGKSLLIHLIYDLSSTLDTNHAYMYKKDPAIETVFPTETIKEGGTMLTVQGSHLSSVAAVTMQTTMVLKKLVQTQPYMYTVTRTEYITPCTTVNDTQLICLTPTIDLPPQFTVATKRRRRDVSSISKTRSMLQILSRRLVRTTNINNQIVKTRFKRNVKIEFSGEGDILEFYIGFNLDGVEDYKNYTTIEVFVEPAFQFDTGVKEYKKGERLSFEGEHLDVGVTVHDYTITVGKEECLKMELLSNFLSCYPPDDKPALEEDNDLGHPKILVHVGVNIKHIAGYLRYPERTMPLYMIILAAVLPVCAIVIVVVLIVVCVKKRHRTT